MARSKRKMSAWYENTMFNRKAYDEYYAALLVIDDIIDDLMLMPPEPAMQGMMEVNDPLRLDEAWDFTDM